MRCTMAERIWVFVVLANPNRVATMKGRLSNPLLDRTYNEN